MPIPGSRTPAHILENLESANVRLHPDTVARIGEELARFEPAGEGAVT